MKKTKVFIYIFSLTLGVIVFGYLGTMIVLPKILNSGVAIGYYERFLSEKLGASVYIEDFKLNVNPNLSLDLHINKFIAKNNYNVEIASIKDLSVVSKSLSLYPKFINVDTIYIDYIPLKKVLSNYKNSKTSKDFDLNNLPFLKINKVYLKIDKSSNLELRGINISKNNKNITAKFVGILKTPYVTKPLILGSEGSISYFKSLKFNNFSLNLESSKILLNGPIYNLKISARDISVNELEKHFLYFYKFIHPNKRNFIENFINFSGTMDINLVLKYGNLYGVCNAKNLSALFSKFRIPVSFKNVNFYFKDKSVIASAKGLFGNEEVDTIFYLGGMFSKNLFVTGKVHSQLSDKFTKKYFPQVKILGYADALVKYKTVQGVSNIDYVLTLNKGSNLLSKYGNLNCVDKNRQIGAHTKKQGETIYLTRYNYYFLNNKTRDTILYGSGIFKKNFKHYKPIFVTLKTKDKIPVRVIQSFTKDFIKNGEISADIKYYFLNKVLTGNINLYNVSHSDFIFFKDMSINVENGKINFLANGTFLDSPISINALADNNFEDNILIHNIDISLDKFVFDKDDYSSLSNEAYKYKNSGGDKDYNVVVEKGKIHVNDILHEKFQMHDVKILGSLKNNVVNFVIPGTVYAKGILSAKGIYNIKDKSSDIHFFASDIDSNEVVTNIFKLPNQVQGLAYAKLHLKSKNKLEDIHAHATFAIHEGYMPKLGSTEFIIKKSKRIKLIAVDKIKFTLSKITNIDFSNKEVLASNIYGSFILNNSDVDRIKIFSQSDYFSVFIEGHYNINSQYSNLCIWGRHNKTEEKKIRIFKIPLSFLYRIIFKSENSKHQYMDKVSKIPPIKLKAGDVESLFRVFITGNLNSDNLKVILKDIK